jgi:hypothetical protein
MCSDVIVAPKAVTQTRNSSATIMANSDTFTNARVESGGSTRGDDDRAHRLFKIIRADGSTLYGEYIYSFLENGNDFNIEIDLFGYAESRYLGSRDPSRRQRFSADEAATAEQLIRSYFLSEPDIYRKAFLPPAKFVGGVTFRPKWVVLKP